MSRHKLVKNLDLDEELEDFDGGAEDEFEDTMSPEDKELLRRGTNEVRQTLGLNFPVTDYEIEDSLYYYYYDVPKTVNYLLNQKTKTQAKKPKKDQVDQVVKSSTASALHTSVEDRSTNFGPGKPNEPLFVPAPLSTVRFFNDAPWLNVPRGRQARILVEPVHRFGGLLGGSAKQEDGPPKSKLAALAATRKKENQKVREAQQTPSSVALLDKLSLTSDKYESTSPPDQMNSNVNRFEGVSDPHPRTYSSWRHRDASPPPIVPKVRQPKSIVESNDVTKSPPAKTVPVASPSVFASAMFGPPAPDADHNMSLLESGLLASSNEANANFDAFAGPSPDDVVLKAQNSSKGGIQGKSPASGPKGGNDENLVHSIKGMSIGADAPKIKQKNLDVASEYARTKAKNAANFVVIGHVDAGKSTLMGRLLHDLKVVDQRTVDKYRKEAEKMGKASFALAWVLDQGTEERERGVTMDIANHRFETEKTVFTILDAPGHRDFIPNMIAGASQADFAVLAIDASTGNFESGLRGQTKEHALLVRSMGVQRVIIAVNKLDTIQWSLERFQEISQQVSAFLTAAGFLAKNLSFVPCSGLTGDNVVHKASEPLAAWYTGPPLIALLESSGPVTRAVEKPLRLTIDDTFKGGVQNPISISGRIDAGTVQVGDSILVMPESQTTMIKGLDVDKKSAGWAVAGQNVVLHLTDIDAKHVRSGDVICPPSVPIQCVKDFSVKLLAFEHIIPMHCEIHRGRLHAPGKVSKLKAVLEKASGTVVKGKKPKLIKPGTVARVAVETEDAIPLESGNRVILRAAGETIGAGLVE